MAALAAVNDYIARIGNGYYANRPFSVQLDAATTGSVMTGQLITMQKFPIIQQMESLPSGVTGYRLTNVVMYASVVGVYRLFKLVDMGTLNLATPTFTDGSAMPTVTEGNSSNATASAVLMEVTTALNALPGNFTITYVDQDGNSAETTSSLAFTASAAVGTCGVIPLNGTDWGARDITTATRTGGTTPTGEVKFWGGFPICDINIYAVQQPAMVNLLTVNTPPPLLGASDQLFIVGMNGTNARRIGGMLTFVGDQA